MCCKEANYVCLACCVGHDHTHLVFKNHERDFMVIAAHLKAAATWELAARKIHPLADFTGKRGAPPTPWSAGCWKVFIDTDEQLRQAIIYVKRHAQKEGLPPQHWDFVTQYLGQ